MEREEVLNVVEKELLSAKDDLGKELVKLRDELNKEIDTLNTLHETRDELKEYARSFATNKFRSSLTIFSFVLAILSVAAYFGIKKDIEDSVKVAKTQAIVEVQRDIGGDLLERLESNASRASQLLKQAKNDTDDINSIKKIYENEIKSATDLSDKLNQINVSVKPHKIGEEDNDERKKLISNNVIIFVSLPEGANLKKFEISEPAIRKGGNINIIRDNAGKDILYSIHTDGNKDNGLAYVVMISLPG